MLSLVTPKAITLSPREWGCTGGAVLPLTNGMVVPTRVGVYRSNRRCVCHPSSVVPTRVGVYRMPRYVVVVTPCCPHASGGVPPFRVTLRPDRLLSPREWGCTYRPDTDRKGIAVVPTRVGVYLGTCYASRPPPRCPHASGGVPPNPIALPPDDQLSPREWGCTASCVTSYTTPEVVPTRVGVYL